MTKFDRGEDKMKFVNVGPWMIFDHYQSVQKWDHNFTAGRVSVEKTMVWARIPSLNLMYCDEDLCIEIELNKHVVGRASMESGTKYNMKDCILFALSVGAMDNIRGTVTKRW